MRTPSDRRGLVSGTKPTSSSSPRRAGARYVDPNDPPSFSDQQRIKILWGLLWVILGLCLLFSTITSIVLLIDNEDRTACVCNPGNTTENPSCCSDFGIEVVGDPLAFQVPGDKDLFFIKGIFAGLGIHIENILNSHLNVSVLIESLTSQLLVGSNLDNNTITLTLDPVIAVVTPGNCTIPTCQSIPSDGSFVNVTFGRIVIDTHGIVDMVNSVFIIPRDGNYRLSSLAMIYDNSTESDPTINGTLGAGPLIERPGDPGYAQCGEGRIFIGYPDGLPIVISDAVKSAYVSCVTPLLAGDIVRQTVVFSSLAPLLDILLLGDIPGGVGSNLTTVYTEFSLTEL